MAEGDLPIRGPLVLPARELHWRFSRSSGPGGQGVNTADSRVELSFDLARSHSFPPHLRERAERRLAPRLVDGVLTLISGARVGFIGLYRNEETLMPVEYYVKLPQDVAERDVILLDPMLATGNSTAAAVKLVKDAGASSVRLIAIIAAPEGIDNIQSQHPDVQIVVAAIDRGLNEKGYIVPGLGDAGDRLYGTK